VTSDPAFNEVLRLPLRRIIESADHIVGRSDGPLRDEYAVYASDISAAAHHLLSVVRSMGQDPASGRATIDLVELVYEAVGLIESAATEREIAIAVEPLQTFTAQGESRGVIQILVNLIGNAVRHSSEQATVTISFEASGRYSTVHVADDGPGIDPADQQRIFERFEQGTTHGPGSGLGLAIARRLARAMGGDIQLESRPGMGSRFSLVLPAA
jgi:signal transduction histidine kinase